MGFALLCVALIALVFSVLVAFAGYRLFLVLLPIWGFFAGLMLGAQAITALLGDAFLGTVTGLVVGFVVGLIFAILAYLFYIFAVAVISFSFGYFAGVGILEWIGLDLSLIVWLIGVVVGIVVAALVLRFNIQKYAIIVITAIGGTAGAIYTLLVAFGNQDFILMALGPVRGLLNTSPLWLLLFIVLAVAAIIFQIRANRSFEIDTYNRWADEPAM
jgi:hypothetical protein